MIRLRHSLVCLALFMLGDGCTADDTLGDDGSDGTMGDTGDTTDTGTEDLTGEQLFMALCSGCHGPEAEGTNIAYEIRHPHHEFATWVIRNGRASVEFTDQMMPQFTPEVLSDNQLDLVLEYLDSFPQPTTGDDLYLDYCRNCHGTDAAGGVVNKDLLNSPIQDFIENVRQGRGGTDYGSRLMYMPARTSAELSDAEITMIFDFVGTL